MPYICIIKLIIHITANSRYSSWTRNSGSAGFLGTFVSVLSVPIAASSVQPLIFTNLFPNLVCMLYIDAEEEVLFVKGSSCNDM